MIPSQERPIPFPLEMITWWDSAGGERWDYLSRHKGSIVKVTSVGYVAREDSDQVVIVPHLHPDQDPADDDWGYRGEVCVPKCCIASRKPLEIADP